MQEEGWELKQSSVVFSSASTQTNTSFPTKQPSQEKNIYKSLGTIKNDQDENRMGKGAAQKAKLKTIQDNSIQRRLHPKCKEDVRLLYSELNLWRKKQFDEIEQKRDIDAENRIKMRSDVLSKETILLRKINSINQGLTASQKKAKIDNVLSQMVTPRRWKLSSGEEIEVQTADMGHLSKLVQIFQRLDHSKAAELNVSQRIKLLDQAKVMLGNTNESLVKEICSLLDREKEFLRRGIRQSLSGLRARISHLFLQFLEKNTDAYHNLSICKSNC
jgi:hypothetical protein